ncbi:helical backbone metal receptor [Flavihumibacter fluvii]|uniref:helical backbone metal receptor n=1 Tax=Flavihumibacter fluvii TaxID=2838157 RepID=UPI001BDE9EA9|nr:helical backbone metal receptor [Flavihumibacter fluvii]ULQ52998.1 helical backbone metal receptor [Flavihumibacter fluvii]
MPIYTDQTGRNIDIPAVPRRIISLVPSQTEFLYDIGLSDEVIGITTFCIHPNSWFRSKTRIGGTKNIHLERILSLQPDLVIANKEENTAAQVLALATKVPVWISDIPDLNAALDMMMSLGEITGRSATASEICRKITVDFNTLASHKTVIRPKTAYLIWKDPYMSVGADTFIHDMLSRMGLDNVFVNYSRYPETSLAHLQVLAPELVFLSSEPYPFKEKHIPELQEHLPNARIKLVDGEYFSWYGSRLLGAVAYFRDLL